DSKPKTVAKVFHSIFCEHGAPRVLITDRDRVHLMRKDVKVVLAKHGVRAHKDFVEVTRALRVSMDRAEGSYVEDYQLAVGEYDDIDWDELKVKYFDTDLLSFVKDSIPLMENSREDYLVTMREYLELWRMRQERNLERMAVTEDR
ncbi:hypothetical protein FOZ63_021213, partial [Perkinsus olseni]